MQTSKKYEVLKGLPPYGPMHVSISENGEKFYNEGFVVRFIKSDGTEWVANFKTGWTNFSTVFELSSIDNIVVIASGQGYLISPDQQKAISTFGPSITQLLEFSDGRFISANETNVVIIHPDGLIWESERISWDGIKELTFNGNIVMGYSYDPMHDADEWVPLYFNIDTKLIEIGSYNRHFNNY